MNVIDNTAISSVLSRNVVLPDSTLFYVTDDIQQEAELAATIHQRILPKNIRSLWEIRDFDKGSFYRNYKTLLDRYNKYSFSNMSGLGDVSILAAVQTLVDKKGAQMHIPLMEDSIEVFVDDHNLSAWLKKEFSPYGVLVWPSSHLANI